jgi:hypothetical protein
VCSGDGVRFYVDVEAVASGPPVYALGESLSGVLGVGLCPYSVWGWASLVRCCQEPCCCVYEACVWGVEETSVVFE